jgi:hypothetical protein
MPAYSGYAFQNDSDRSATLENLTPVSDPIASTTSTQLKLSSFPNPHIAWIYYKVDALTHFILETKLTSPTISGQPIVGRTGDITSSATHPNWNHEPTVDMRNAPNSFGISSSDPIEAFARDTDVGGEAARIACVLGVTDGTPLVSSNSTPFRVDYTQTYTGFSASTQDTWSNQDLSSLTTTASIPDVPVRVVGARLNDSGAVAFRLVYPRGSSLRPTFIACNSHADQTPNLNFNSLGRDYLAVSEEPSIDILSFDNSTASDLTLYLQRA